MLSLGGCVCMSFPCCKCDHSCLSQSQLRVCGTLMFCVRRVGWQHRLSVRWSWKTITVRSVIEHMRRFMHLRRQRLKMTKDRKERLKLNEGFPLLQEPSPPFSSPLSSSPHPAAPVLWWIRCWAGWPDRKCSPPPSVCLCKRRSRERERGELFLTQAGCRRRKNERLC